MRLAISTEELQDIRVEGASDDDVVYEHETEGIFNVSRMRLHLSDSRVQRLISPITDSVRAANAAADVCEELVGAMTAERSEEPLYVLEMLSETWLVVDGNNRLRRRILDGRADFRSYAFPVPMLELFRVRIMIKVREQWAEHRSEKIPNLGQHVRPGSEEDLQMKKNLAEWRKTRDQRH